MIPTHKKVLGLIAGNGKFPFLFAHEARRKGYRIVTAAIKGDTSWLLGRFVDKIFWVGPGELKKLFTFFKDEGAAQVIMAGQVNPKNLFDDKLVIDEEFKRLFEALQDRKADTIFLAVAAKLRENGMELLDSTFLLADHLAPKGTLTKRGPSERELADVDFGRIIAKFMGGLDVGQTVAIKDKAIVAIEAMEGTDCTIRRSGAIAGQGVVIVKMSKPKQDARFDVPVIGPRTLRAMIRARASCLAVEAGKTLIIDREACVKLADRHGICLLGA